jgi:hypothetical protein
MISRARDYQDEIEKENLYSGQFYTEFKNIKVSPTIAGE